MIIEQDIKLNGRASLKLMKGVAKEERDERKARISRGGQLFFEKWNTDRLGAHFTQIYLPKLLSETVEKMIMPSEEKKANDDEGNDTSFKSILMETVERIVPLLIKRVIA
jgi:hypothetical protein